MSRAPVSRPSLLFVFADQMRGSDLGCAGNPDVRTPVLDSLAAEGVRAARAYANVPVCGPSRACLLTGTHPTTNRVIANDLPLPAGLPTLGTLARANGYRTGYVGKWHLDGAPRSRFTPPGERRFGFDFWAAYNCTHDYFRTRYYRDTPEVILAEGYEPELQTDLALEFLEAQPGAPDPFCLVVSWGPPHDPYEWVPERHRAMYDPAAIRLRPNARPAAPSPMAVQQRLECRRATADYYAAITALDEQLGRLLAALEARGLAQDTLVVFTSDHGDMLWSHGLLKKQAPYEESVHVPFLARLPGRLAAGSLSESLIGTVDVLPTLAGLLGWEAPAGLEGLDLSSALQGLAGAPEPRSLPLSSPYSIEEAERQGLPDWRAVRTKRHTYAETVGRQPWLLFDTVADPYQLENLAHDPASHHLRDALAAELGAWLERTRDPFLPGPLMIAHLGLSDAWRERERDRDW